MLAALERAVVDIEITFLKILGGDNGGAGFEGLADGSQLKRDKVGLGDHTTVAIKNGRRSIAGLPQDGGVGRTDELGAHFPRRSEQPLADNSLIDWIEFHDSASDVI